jgi:hypothetical protein
VPTVQLISKPWCDFATFSLSFILQIDLHTAFTFFMTVRSFPDHLLFDGMLHVDAAPL